MDNFNNRLSQILFYTYITNYNIRQIYSLLAEKHDNTFDRFLQSSFKNGENTTKIVNEAENKVRVALDKLKFFNIEPIIFDDPHYPQHLKDLDDKPPIIYIKGEIKNIPLVAVVGTREVSAHSERVTNTIVEELGSFGFGVASGLAKGIDTLAHRAALNRNLYTVAVLPKSLDTIFPQENYGLANEILESGGCLISELCFDINRGNKSFVQRNRIQSGLSKIVVPIEMREKSGTMHTVNFCIRQKRILMLLYPSSEIINIPQYEGIRKLISEYSNKANEKVVIVHGLNNLRDKLKSFSSISLPEEQLNIFDLLKESEGI